MFQAVQHQCADMYLETESSRSAVYYAGWALEENSPDAATSVSIAKMYASDAGRTVGNRGIQIHGGMGFTWENDLTCSTVVRRHRKQHSEIPRFIASASPRWLSILAAHLRRARKLHSLAREPFYERSSAIHKRQRNCRHHHQQSSGQRFESRRPRRHFRSAGSDAQDDSVKAVILIGGGRTFVAGADIKEFGRMASGKPRGAGLLPLLLKIEDSSKPVIVAIHGTAFGGGLELAMAGHYRVALSTAQVGQPEVKLGLIPGAAGTQRLPRLAGVARAVEMCTSGNPVKAEEALKFGIVDRLIEEDLLAGAVAFAREVAGKCAPKTRERDEKLGNVADNVQIFRPRARRLLKSSAVCSLPLPPSVPWKPLRNAIRRRLQG